MAMEKLYELAHDGGFDLIVVDTPPTRNALDFLDAPRRLTRFLGHRLFQMLLMPTRAYLRAVSVATQALLRTISKVAGPRSSTTPWPSSRPSRGWRRASGSGPTTCGGCWPGRPRPSSS
jgi:hypothetical protein